MQVRQAFATREQSEKEDWMQYLDASEGLGSQGFPDELVTTKRFETLQRFIEVVCDAALRRELYHFTHPKQPSLPHPPSIAESLTFTTRQLQRTRPKSSLPYDPRYAMMSRPHPFAPLPPNKMALPQRVLPPSPSNAPINPAVAPPAARLPLGACFNCVQTGHFARDCSIRDQSRKPAVVPA